MLPPDANMKGRVITIPVVNLFINLLGLQHAVHKIKILNDYEISKKKKKKSQIFVQGFIFSLRISRDFGF